MRVNCGASQNVNMAEFHVDYTIYILCDSKRLDKEAALLDFQFSYPTRVLKKNLPCATRTALCCHLLPSQQLVLNRDVMSLFTTNG